MKRARYFVVDAFATARLRGNAAGVCLLETWWTDATLQAIAEENNLAETAFLVRSGERFELRWFTPTTEVDLCGHATLASAHVLIHHTRHAGERIEVSRRGGELLCEDRGARVGIAGHCETYLQGEITWRN